MTFGHGVVIGKFRPPHKGHSLLIRTALEQCDRVSVIVCSHAEDTIPAWQRAHWIREMHPLVGIAMPIVTDLDPDDSALWARKTLEWVGKPDAVFTSEAYGDPWAEALGCVHVCVDRAREAVPISASRILANPTAHLGYLDPPVRAYFVRRVVLVGADSTGKTTLGKMLAAHYKTTFVPEFGRTYWEGLLTVPREGGCTYPETVKITTGDFQYVAFQQACMEERLAQHANRVLVCDTDSLTTFLWERRYLGHASVITGVAAERKNDIYFPTLYLLCFPDFPWVDDGTRELPEQRPDFHEWIKAAYPTAQHLVGDIPTRFEAAKMLIDALL